MRLLPTPDFRSLAAQVLAVGLYATKTSSISACLICLFALCAGTSWAQPAPPAQSAAEEYLRQQERTFLLRAQQEQVPDVRVTSPAIPPI